MPQCQFLFSAVFGSRKAVRAIFSELDEINAKPPIFPGRLQNTEEESEEPGGGLPTWWRDQGGAHAQVWCGAPLAPLRHFSGSLGPPRQNIYFCLRGVQFREYFLCRISETKNSRKQELVLQHLVNRLVPENA